MRSHVLWIAVLAGCTSARNLGGTDGQRTPAAQCGDGLVSATEACDDGNLASGDGCSATCTVEATCNAEACRFEVYEWTVAHDDAPYANPFEEVTLAMTLTAPSGATIAVPGFYYDADTWKVRFAPREVGTYAFTYRLDDANGTQVELQGSLEVGGSADRGFLRPHPTNPHRYVYEGDGGLFAGVGVSTCVRDSVAPAFPTVQEPKGWCIDKYRADDAEACGKTWPAWSSVYIDETAVDLFRWTVNNCSYPLWVQLATDGGTPNNVYHLEWGKWGDRMVRDLRRRGVRIVLDPVGFGWQNAAQGRTFCGPNFDEDCTAWICGADRDRPCTDQNAALVDPNDVAALERYYTYIVARYGAYVDVIELINEYHFDDGVLGQLAEHVKRVDPYDHPVTTSWARPDHPSIDLSTPHVYQRSNGFDVDRTLLSAVVDGNYDVEPFAKASHGKPIIVGELGEPFGPDESADFEVRTRLGTRVKLWTGFFNEVSGIPWESSLSGAQFLGGVVFLSPELRADYRALSRFTDDVDADVRIAPLASLDANGEPVRVYTLRGAARVYGYLFHGVADPARPQTVDGLAVAVDVPRAGTLEWYSTADGSVLAMTPVQAGLQTVTAPSFTHDLAFRTRPN